MWLRPRQERASVVTVFHIVNDPLLPPVPRHNRMTPLSRLRGSVLSRSIEGSWLAIQLRVMAMLWAPLNNGETYSSPLAKSLKLAGLGRLASYEILRQFIQNSLYA
jgi:hypothetical protein